MKCTPWDEDVDCTILEITWLRHLEMQFLSFVVFTDTFPEEPSSSTGVNSGTVEGKGKQYLLAFRYSIND